MADTRSVIDVEDTSEFLAVAKAFAILGVSEATGYRLIRNGEFPLPTVRIGRRTKVAKSAIKEFIARQQLVEAS